MYSGCRIAFGVKGEWGFDNDYTRNVIIFGVDNSSSSDSDNLKNNFFVLGEGNTFGINGSFGVPNKKISVLILVKQTQKFAWTYIIMVIIVACLLMEQKYLNLKPTIKVVLCSTILSGKYF